MITLTLKDYNNDRLKENKDKIKYIDKLELINSNIDLNLLTLTNIKELTLDSCEIYNIPEIYKEIETINIINYDLTKLKINKYLNNLQNLNIFKCYDFNFEFLEDTNTIKNINLNGCNNINFYKNNFKNLKNVNLNVCSKIIFAEDYNIKINCINCHSILNFSKSKIKLDNKNSLYEMILTDENDDKLYYEDIDNKYLNEYSFVVMKEFNNDCHIIQENIQNYYYSINDKFDIITDDEDLETYETPEIDDINNFFD